MISTANCGHMTSLFKTLDGIDVGNTSPLIMRWAPVSDCQLVAIAASDRSSRVPSHQVMRVLDFSK